jgi:pSer/pThr/pTyr-binding forkhead associated (FHA) protein
MRLHFPNAEHPDLFWAEGRLSIGSSDAHRVRVVHPAIVPDHIAIDVDAVRGLELSVLTPGADVFVNGRPVQEKAILRLGDRLQLGAVELTLKSDTDQREQPPQAAANGSEHGPAAVRINLRAIAGPYFGKTLALKTRSVLGRGTDCDIVLNEPQLSRQHAIIENTARGIFLRDLDSSNGTSINGVMMRNAVLKLGDQIAFDQNRFVLESGGVSPIDLLMAAKTPSVPTPVHTMVSKRLVPPPPAPVAATQAAKTAPPAAADADATPGAWINRLANILMLVAALFALAGIGFLLYSELS